MRKVCGEDCLLAPGHAGFHKSNLVVWANAGDRTDWAAIGRRLMAGEAPGSGSMPWLSLREMEYAIDEARQASETLGEMLRREEA